MPTQQLIYETAVPVSAARHGTCAVQVGDSYGFCRKLNSVPLVAAEFSPASVDYVVVFAATGTPDELAPVVLLGARAAENVYLDGTGAWGAPYVPAFVRRYPFIFSTADDGKNFTLCVDEAFPGLNWQGRGEALFDAQGKPSPYVDGVLRFLQDYRLEFTRTGEFARRLQALDLFEPMQAEFTLASGEKLALTGFQAVSLTRLHALDDAALATLARQGDLELVHLHLHSLRNFQSLSQRISRASAGTAPADQAETA
ncbi:SapC family protein [Roseateles sp. LYH14W]|uniref:SapC family protein n=1 Tax=Pelomonas parva TaxID=3299032 RepID=A0ABW7F9Y1_9BURK